MLLLQVRRVLKETKAIRGHKADVDYKVNAAPKESAALKALRDQRETQALKARQARGERKVIPVIKVRQVLLDLPE